MIDQWQELTAKYKKMPREILLKRLMKLSIDPLTKFFPRPILFEEINERVMPQYLEGATILSLESVLERLKMENEITFAKFDIRLLKQANSLSGLYSNGDLMIQIATRCLGSVGFDIMGKMGGDEFLFVSFRDLATVEQMCILANSRMTNNWQVILDLQDKGELTSNNFALELCARIREAKIKFEAGEIKEEDIPSQTLDGIPIYTDYALVSLAEATNCLEVLLMAGWRPDENRLLSKVLVDISISVSEIRLTLAKTYNKALLLYDHHQQGEKVYKKAKDFIVSRGTPEDYVFPSKEWEVKDLAGNLETYVVLMVVMLLLRKHSDSIYEKVVTEIALAEWLEIPE